MSEERTRRRMLNKAVMTVDLGLKIMGLRVSETYVDKNPQTFGAFITAAVCAGYAYALENPFACKSFNAYWAAKAAGHDAAKQMDEILAERTKELTKLEAAAKDYAYGATKLDRKNGLKAPVREIIAAYCTIVIQIWRTQRQTNVTVEQVAAHKADLGLWSSSWAA